MRKKYMVVVSCRRFNHDYDRGDPVFVIKYDDEDDSYLCERLGDGMIQWVGAEDLTTIS